MAEMVDAPRPTVAEFAAAHADMTVAGFAKAHSTAKSRSSTPTRGVPARREEPLQGDWPKGDRTKGSSPRQTTPNLRREERGARHWSAWLFPAGWGLIFDPRASMAPNTKGPFRLAPILCA